MARIVAAVFDDPMDAQRAVDTLREEGVPENAITVISRQDSAEYSTAEMDDYDGDVEEAGKGALAGAGIGAGVGALFGLAVAAVPGIGPFLTAGAAALSGALLGGAAGGLAGALTNWGLHDTEADYFAGEIERSATFVGVDLEETALDRERVQEILRRFHGRFPLAAVPPHGAAEPPAV